MFASFRKRVSSERPFEMPLVDENLVDIGGSLNVATLLRAYRGGAFPWTVHPVTWWSPDPRAVIETGSLHAPRSLLRSIRQRRLGWSVNQAFDRVIEACAAATSRRRTTWITPEFLSAYKDMHRAGYAHSLEVWEDGELSGGIYGVGIGGYFAGESMFHRAPDASKAALYFLAGHLQERGYTLFDVQMPTRITLQMGATLIARQEFLARLEKALRMAVSFTGGAGAREEPGDKTGCV